MMNDRLPVYIISVAADLLGIHPRTLYLYEEKGLLVPARKGNRRFYSVDDLAWVRSIRWLVHERGFNLQGLGRLLALRALLEYENASPERQKQCRDYVGSTQTCWHSNPAQSECYTCAVYSATRAGLCADEGIPQSFE